MTDRTEQENHAAAREREICRLTDTIAHLADVCDSAGAELTGAAAAAAEMQLDTMAERKLAMAAQCHEAARVARRLTGRTE